MIGKFLSKYILEVIPSIVATVVGAYIVTHYINSKPEADKPKANVAAPANPAAAKDGKKDAKAEPAEADDTGSAKAAKSDPVLERKAAPAETAAAPAEPRRQPAPRPKAVPASQPAETSKPDETRDANEIARAAIERLRGAEPRLAEKPRTPEPVQESARPERTRVNPVVYAPVAPVQQAPVQVQPLPQAVTIAPSPPEATVGAAPAPFPAPIDGPATERAESSRPAPPADIPSRPLELRTKDRTSVAEDVVSTAKSVFHAVIPGIN
jgi:hypothetical protein